MSFTAPAFLDALKTALDANATLTALTSPSVRVTTYFPSADEALTDVVILGHTVVSPMDPAALGQKRYKEDVTIQCEIRVIRAGAGETVAKAARDRAAAVLGAIHVQLKDSPPNVGDQTISAKITDREMIQFPSESGGAPVRVCLVAFNVVYEARVSGS